MWGKCSFSTLGKVCSVSVKPITNNQNSEKIVQILQAQNYAVVRTMQKIIKDSAFLNLVTWLKEIGSDHS